jgi:chromosome segregation ATPase
MEKTMSTQLNVKQQEQAKSSSPWNFTNFEMGGSGAVISSLLTLSTLYLEIGQLDNTLLSLNAQDATKTAQINGDVIEQEGKNQRNQMIAQGAGQIGQSGIALGGMVGELAYEKKAYQQLDLVNSRTYSNMEQKQETTLQETPDQQALNKAKVENETERSKLSETLKSKSDELKNLQNSAKSSEENTSSNQSTKENAKSNSDNTTKDKESSLKEIKQKIDSLEDELAKLKKTEQNIVNQIHKLTNNLDLNEDSPSKIVFDEVDNETIIKKYMTETEFKRFKEAVEKKAETRVKDIEKNIHRLQILNQGMSSIPSGIGSFVGGEYQYQAAQKSADSQILQQATSQLNQNAQTMGSKGQSYIQLLQTISQLIDDLNNSNLFKS